MNSDKSQEMKTPSFHLLSVISITGELHVAESREHIDNKNKKYNSADKYYYIDDSLLVYYICPCFKGFVVMKL